jgi:hypothetical protein
MTIDAGKFGEMGLPMALKAEGPSITSSQQEPVRRSMWGMADTAALDLHRLVFENPGTSFLRMAFKTGVVIKFIPFLQTGPGSSPVRSVAIGAFHCPFQHLVPGWKIKLSLDFLVAG